MRRCVALRRGLSAEVYDRVALAFEDRTLDRTVLTSDAGVRILMDFPDEITLRPGDVIELDDARLVAVAAAVEPLYEVRGEDFHHLTRVAWHLGRRRIPVQIEPFRLLTEREMRTEGLLGSLGTSITPVRETFEPEDESLAQ